MTEYIPTRAAGYNHGDTKNFNRMIADVTTLPIIEQLRNKLQLGGIYNINHVPCECLGIYKHHALFLPVKGRVRFSAAYSYTELCQGVLEGVNDLMGGVLPYTEDLVGEED